MARSARELLEFLKEGAVACTRPRRRARATHEVEAPRDLIAQEGGGKKKLCERKRARIAGKEDWQRKNCSVPWVVIKSLGRGEVLNKKGLNERFRNPCLADLTEERSRCRTENSPNFPDAQRSGDLVRERLEGLQS